VLIFCLAQKIKEKYCYTCPKIDKEFEKYDKDPKNKFKQFVGKDGAKEYTVDVGYERFLGPELFFNPEIFSREHSTPLSELVDDCIQACPIDTRRVLYRNICLSGGSTMFKDFGRRLQRDIARRTKQRLELANKEMNHKAKEIEVNVITHRMQRFAVWFGGSMLSQLPQFGEMVIKKEEYEEHGARIARHSRVFQSL